MSTFSLDKLRVIEPATRNCLILVISTFILIYFKRRSDRQLPPYFGGWIPWLGCAVNFGKQPLEFIRQKSQQVRFMK